MRRAGVLVSVMSLGLLVGGCGMMPFGERGCYQPATYGRGVVSDDRRGTEFMAELMTECDLTSEDVYLVSLGDFMREEDARGKSSAEVKDMIAEYRRENTDDYRSLFYNPVTEAPIDDYSSVRRVFLSLTRYDDGEHATPWIEVTVDFETAHVESLDEEHVFLIYEETGTRGTLSAQAVDDLLALLPQSARWPAEEYADPLSDWHESSYQSWTLVIVDSAYQLHRYHFSESQRGDESKPALAPPGFEKFVAKFREAATP